MRTLWSQRFSCVYSHLYCSGLPSHWSKARSLACKVRSAVTPVGRWKTIDDATGKISRVVVIWEEDGTLYGRIEKLANPDPHDPDPRCTRCEGVMKDKPLIGLRIFATSSSLQWDSR